MPRSREHLKELLAAATRKLEVLHTEARNTNALLDNLAAQLDREQGERLNMKRRLEALQKELKAKSDTDPNLLSRLAELEVTLSDSLKRLSSIRGQVTFMKQTYDEGQLPVDYFVQQLSEIEMTADVEISLPKAIPGPGVI